MLNNNAVTVIHAPAPTPTPTPTPEVPTGKVITKEVDPKGKVEVKNNELTNADKLIIKAAATIEFDSKAVKSLAAKGDLIISVVEADKSKMSEQQREMIGDRPVYNITVNSKNEIITTFEGGRVNASIPYKLKAGEDAKAVLVYYVTANGTLKPIYSSYDVETQAISFTTSHLSTYAVGYNKVKFTDTSGWAEQYITYLAARNVIGGTGNGTFEPNSNVTRAQFVTMLFGILGEDKSTLDKYKQSIFTDVKNNAWFTPYVMWASENGITDGVGNNKFEPNKEITREQMATMIYKFMKHYELSLNSKVEAVDFADKAKISPWAVEATKYLQTAGIINGTGKGKFAPQDIGKRSEAAAIIAGLMEGIVK